jgi:hypothetical protein
LTGGAIDEVEHGMGVAAAEQQWDHDRGHRFEVVSVCELTDPQWFAVTSAISRLVRSAAMWSSPH